MSRQSKCFLQSVKRVSSVLVEDGCWGIQPIEHDGFQKLVALQSEEGFISAETRELLRCLC